MIGIYKITSPNNKVYIGQSINIKHRFLRYNSINCKGQCKLYNSLKKYGVNNHKFEILHLCDIEQLNELERYYQDLFEVINKYGLNLKLTKTNEKRPVYNTEVIENWRKKSTGVIKSKETCKKLSIATKGIKKSREAVLKSIESRKNFKHSEKSILQISKAKSKKVINIKTNFIYNSVIEAAIAIDMNYNTLMCRLNGNIKNTTELKYLKDYERT